MALQVKQVPYEFLARWDKSTGTLAGAHIKLLTVVSDDTGATPDQYMEGDAQPIAMAIGDIGFPLGQLLDSLHVSALETMQADKDASDKAIADLNAAAVVAKQDSDAALAVVQTELADTRSKLQEVTAQLAAVVSTV